MRDELPENVDPLSDLGLATAFLVFDDAVPGDTSIPSVRAAARRLAVMFAAVRAEARSDERAAIVAYMRTHYHADALEKHIENGDHATEAT